MSEQQNSNGSNSQEETIDIIWLIRYVWAKRKFIIISTVVMCSLCILKYVCSPNLYNSTASILPLEQGGGVSGNMGMLASMAGVNLKSSSENVITSDLYPAVASSTPYMKKLMTIPLKWNEMDTVMSTYEYILRREPTVMDYIKQYTIGLPGTIKRALEPPVDINIDAILAKNGDMTNQSYLVLSKEELAAIGLLSSMVFVSEDSKIDAINVSATCENQEQAVVLASSALDILQEIITEFKTKRSSQTLEFLEERYNGAKEDYEKIRTKFFNYKDTHRNMIDERIDVQYQELSDQYQISYQILKTLAQQIEEAKLEVLEETPCFSVLQPAVMPYEKAKPKIMIHIIAGVVLGLFFSIGWLIAKIVYYQIFDEKKYKAIKAQYESKEEEAA